MNKEDYTERDWLDLIYQATQATYRETKRIRNNVLFFFWLTIIGMFFWVVALLLGGFAALMGLSSIGN